MFEDLYKLDVFKHTSENYYFIAKFDVLRSNKKQNANPDRTRRFIGVTSVTYEHHLHINNKAIPAKSRGVL
jgi:hypothetical protein